MVDRFFEVDMSECFALLTSRLARKILLTASLAETLKQRSALLANFLPLERLVLRLHREEVFDCKMLGKHEQNFYHRHREIHQMRVV